MSEELKPCPFCGNAGRELSEQVEEKTRYELREDGSGDYLRGDDGKIIRFPAGQIYQAHIECWMCGAKGPQTALYDSRESALKSLRAMLNDEGWNTRTDQSS
jgi:hypothetical protein